MTKNVVRFRSVLGQSPDVSFQEALFRGLAPDGSLYVPERIPRLPDEVIRSSSTRSLTALGLEVVSLFIDEIPLETLEEIFAKALNFPIPLVRLDEDVCLLELFHGPTLSFKDVGARFMAQAMAHFLEQEDKNITVLVATSGDTGSAVAHGFHNVPRVRVVVLYPSGKVSSLQEQQITTLGGNTTAVEVDGTFDDCQKLVKQALAEPDIAGRCNLTTANSINVGRLIPQISYFAWGVAQWQRLRQPERQRGSREKAGFVVPSGNFGNLTAGIYAKRMGVPVDGFVAAVNANDVVPEYLRTGTFAVRPSIQTISNAMDVGNPSNLRRLEHLAGNDLAVLRQYFNGFSVSDEDTRREIKQTFEATSVMLDPHTAVGTHLARRLAKRGGFTTPIIVAATAHPGKFPEIVGETLGRNIPLPEQLERIVRLPKQSTRIAFDFDQLRSLLLD